MKTHTHLHLGWPKCECIQFTFLSGLFLEKLFEEDIFKSLHQVLGTAMLLLCLMALADQRNQPVVPGGEPVGVGLLVLLIGVSLGSNSGYAINPTRDLGPRVFTLMAGWGIEVFR